jgi:hypothetical protein
MAKKEWKIVDTKPNQRPNQRRRSLPTSLLNNKNNDRADASPMKIFGPIPANRRRSLTTSPRKNYDRDDGLPKPNRRRMSLPPLSPNKNNDRDDDLPLIVETKPKRRNMLSKIKKVLQMRDRKL